MLPANELVCSVLGEGGVADGVVPEVVEDDDADPGESVGSGNGNEFGA
jgi:hypothetical protein